MKGILTFKFKHKKPLWEELLENKDKEIERLKESEEYHRVGYAELYKRIDEVMDYIKENYTNKDGSIWHEAMQDIYKIIEGVDKE